MTLITKCSINYVLRIHVNIIKSIVYVKSVEAYLP